MCIDRTPHTASVIFIILCLWLFFVLPGAGLAEDEWQEDQRIDLVLGAIERPIWQPILLPGVEKQRGMPRSPIYRQISPAAQLDFRSPSAFEESANEGISDLQGAASLGSGGSIATPPPPPPAEGSPDVAQQGNGGVVSQPPSQPVPNNPSPNQPPQQTPQIDPPEIEPPDLPGPNLPGF